MARSQDIAAAVALKYLGYKVVCPPARRAGRGDRTRLARGEGRARADRHHRRDRREARPDDCRRAPADGAHKPGDRVRVGLRAGKGLARRSSRRRTAPARRRTATPGARSSGSSSRPQPQIDLPFPVKIDTGQIGGPSAGLAFALDVVEELGHDITQATRSRRRASSTSTARSARSAASSRKRSACAARAWTSSLCLLGITPKRPASTQDRSRSSLWRVFDRRCARWQRCQLKAKK